MDERRIERALREGPPDEPAYDRSMSRELLSASVGEATYGGPVRPAGVSFRFSFATMLAAVVVLITATLLIRPAFVDGPAAPDRPDALATLQQQGTIRIAVTGGHPQTTSAGGAVIGFDVDVARALADELGLRADITVVPTEDILAGRGTWDIALPSSGLPVAADLTRGGDYYEWPSYLVVLDDSTMQGVADLEGGAMCAVSGSASLAWLRGELDAPSTRVDLPAGVTAVERATDDECLAALRAEDAVAALSAELLDDELAGLGVRAIVDGPALLDRRGVVVRGTGSEVATLVDALDAALDDLRDAGTLAAASRSAFGGRDLNGDVR